MMMDDGGCWMMGTTGGVFLLLHCTVWWRVIYLLCLVVSRLKGVLVI